MDELYKKCCKFINVIVVKILIEMALDEESGRGS